MDEKMQEAIENIIDEIRPPLMEIERLQQERLDLLKSKIKVIVSNQYSNKQTIEKLLDELLDIAYWDKKSVKKTFNELINFYKKTDKNNALEYEKYYRKI